MIKVRVSMAQLKASSYSQHSKVCGLVINGSACSRQLSLLHTQSVGMEVEVLDETGRWERACAKREGERWKVLSRQR